jgi:hypothetical protein
MLGEPPASNPDNSEYWPTKELDVGNTEVGAIEPANADGVSKRGSGWVSGTFVRGGGEVAMRLAIGVR